MFLVNKNDDNHILLAGSIPESVNGGAWNYFSAACWFFGRDLFDSLKYPIGKVTLTVIIV